MNLVYLKDVTSLELDTKKCVNCGLCSTVCPHAVFDIIDNKTQIAQKDRCIECGACALNCPTEAISVTSGVGCAQAFIKGALTGTEPSCDCSSGSSCC
ncbi:ferredoxin [bacterium E08(2017)]|nr:ferredoxin [bacterium E08(2017)]